MNTWVVREFGPEVAKVIVPRVLLCLTGSSGMLAARHVADTAGRTVDPELHHEACEHAEEADIVVEAVLDEIIEAVGAVRRPIAIDLKDEGALAGVEPGFVGRRRLLGERCRIGEVSGLRLNRPRKTDGDGRERKRQKKAKFCHQYPRKKSDAGFDGG